MSNTIFVIVENQRGYKGSVDIRQAVTSQELAQVGQLFRQYYAWLAEEHGIDMSYQGVEAELASLPGYYAEPRGRLLLVLEAEGAAGCGAFRPINEKICEFKRMYVKPEFRGKGMGRAIAVRLLEEARNSGYEIARLDTASFLKEAQALYQSLGFKVIGPYYRVPEEALKWTVFMERRL
jgi:GNAT superfamily N-acetyltransferase